MQSIIVATNKLCLSMLSYIDILKEFSRFSKMKVILSLKLFTKSKIFRWGNDFRAEQK